MTSLKIGILESQDFSSKAFNRLATIGEVSMYEKSICSLGDFINDKEIIFVRLSYHINENLLQNADRLRYICSPTTGLNHLDIDYLEKRNIHVISLKGEIDFLKEITATSEHTVGLLISLLRCYKKIFTSKDIKPKERDSIKGFEINSSKIGIIGLGRIGSHLSGYFNSFGAQVNFYDCDISKTSSFATRYNSIEDLIQASSIVILCASYSSENDKIINKKMIDMMAGKFFINISRGELIDENYLLQCVRKNMFRGVAIDVISNEHGEDSNMDEILQLNGTDLNFIYTPHMGGATQTSMKKTEQFVTEKLLSCVK